MHGSKFDRRIIGDSTSLFSDPEQLAAPYSQLYNCRFGRLIHSWSCNSLQSTRWLDKKWSCHRQACKLKFKLREPTFCLCSTAAWAVCYEGSVAGLDATETGQRSLNLHLILQAWPSAERLWPSDIFPNSNPAGSPCPFHWLSSWTYAPFPDTPTFIFLLCVARRLSAPSPSPSSSPSSFSLVLSPGVPPPRPPSDRSWPSGSPPSWPDGISFINKIALQGDPSGNPRPPVNFKTKLPFWPGLVWPGQAKEELLFWSQREVVNYLMEWWFTQITLYSPYSLQ